MARSGPRTARYGRRVGTSIGGGGRCAPGWPGRGGGGGGRRGARGGRGRGGGWRSPRAAGGAGGRGGRRPGPCDSEAVRHPEFWSRMERALGPSSPRAWAHRFVMADRGGRTAEEALEAG